MQNHLWNSKRIHNSIKEQSSTLCSAQLPLPHETRGLVDIFHEFVNAGENCIVISNNKKVSSEIHGPYIKPSGWNRNKIQQPMRSSSEVLALLTHATTLDVLSFVGDHILPPHTMRKSLECFTDAQVAHKVTAMKFSK